MAEFFASPIWTGFLWPLIIMVATGVAWLALSGLILLFRSFRRADIAWLMEPFERLAARRVRERQ